MYNVEWYDYWKTMNLEQFGTIWKEVVITKSQYCLSIFLHVLKIIKEVWGTVSGVAFKISVCKSGTTCMHCHFLCTKHVGSSGAASLLTCIREVAVSNFGRDTGSPDRIFLRPGICRSSAVN